MINEIDLLNSGELDESFSNAVDAGAVGGIVGSVLDVVKSGSQMKATRAEMEEKTSCEKPKFFSGRKKKDAYKKCLADAVEASKKRVEVGKEARIESIKSSIIQKQQEAQDNKILGINKTAFYIGVGVLVLIGGIITYKVIKAKQK